MATSDLIARFILEMLEDSDGSAELQRSVLAYNEQIMMVEMRWATMSTVLPPRLSASAWRRAASVL